VIPDESFTIHKVLGEPLTPFTIIANREGKVLFTHLGVIEDIDSFFQLIEDLLK
jgi:hypothetical protein